MASPGWHFGVKNNHESMQAGSEGQRTMWKHIRILSVLIEQIRNQVEWAFSYTYTILGSSQWPALVNVASLQEEYCFFLPENPELFSYLYSVRQEISCMDITRCGGDQQFLTRYVVAQYLKIHSWHSELDFSCFGFDCYSEKILIFFSVIIKYV